VLLFCCASAGVGCVRVLRLCCVVFVRCCAVVCCLLLCVLLLICYTYFTSFGLHKWWCELLHEIQHYVERLVNSWVCASQV
jgi:hypothetical protein